MASSDNMNALLQAVTANLNDEEVCLGYMQGLIAAAISVKRQEKHLSQKQFADLLGVSQGLVSRWEAGDCNFTLSTIVKIACALDLEVQPPIVPLPAIRYATHNDNIVYAFRPGSWINNSISEIGSFATMSTNESDLKEM